jgi:uncharacterized membrane protein YfcA
MSVIAIAGLGLAGFIAGAINSVAGGGSLISFPALLAAGYPSITANVTNTVAIWPGTVGGSLAYRPELSGQGRRVLLLGVVSVAGALLGSVLLLASPLQLFDRLVPLLILFACALLVVQPRLGAWVQRHQPAYQSRSSFLPLIGAQFLAAVYGGYFGAGLGIMVLAFLGIFIADDLQRLNALKGVLALIVNGVAVIYFVLFGPVAWPVTILMAVTSWIGGYLGVRLARRLSGGVLRAVVLVFGVVVALKLLI